MGMGERVMGWGLVAAILATVGVNMAARFEAPQVAPMGALERAQTQGSKRAGPERLPTASADGQDGEPERSVSPVRLTIWRETPPKDRSGWESERIHSARAQMEAARAAAQSAPECFEQGRAMGEKGTAEEGWELLGPRLADGQAGCGARALEAAWKAIDGSGLRTQEAFALAQMLSTMQVASVVEDMEKGLGDREQYQSALAALDASKAREASAWGQQAWKMKWDDFARMDARILSERRDGEQGSIAQAIQEISRQRSQAGFERWREAVLRGTERDRVSLGQYTQDAAARLGWAQSAP